MGSVVPVTLLWFAWTILAVYAGYHRHGLILIAQATLSIGFLLWRGIPTSGDSIFGALVVFGLPLAVGGLAYLDSSRALRLKKTRHGK